MLNPNRWWKLVFSCRILRVVFDVRWSNKRNGMNFVMWGDCITLQGPFRRCCRGINKEECHKGRLVFSVLARMLPPPPSSHPSFYSHFSSPSLPPPFWKAFTWLICNRVGLIFITVVHFQLSTVCADWIWLKNHLLAFFILGRCFSAIFQRA